MCRNLASDSFQKKNQASSILKQTWSVIPAMQISKCRYLARSSKNKNLKSVFLLIYRNLARDSSQKKMRGGNPCDTKAI